jgi:spermidine synthase
MAVFTMTVLASSLFSNGNYYHESLYNEWQQAFKIDKILYEEKTEHQHLVIFENSLFGRVMALDGVIQLTEADEYVYHEMLTHVPLLAHGNAENVLIIGGGDGGIMREVIRHKNVKKVVLVEIDGAVVEFSKKLLPFISQGAFEDPRVEVIITDGAEYVKTTKDRFDVIICDSTDPVGPGAVLFTEEFYGNCKSILKEKGIFVNQNGVPFLQGHEVTDTYVARHPHFKDVWYYLAAIPTYAGGYMALGWASDCIEHRKVSAAELEARLKNIDGEMKYYSPALHIASFALPIFIQNRIPYSGN